MSNEYDALLAEAPTDQQALRSSLYGAVKENPDQFAEAKRLSDTTGVPAPVVARNLPEVRQRAQASEYDALLTTSPKLAGKLQDPNFASLAHDDVAPLAKLEAATQPPDRDSIFTAIGHANLFASYQAWQGIKLQYADAMGDAVMADRVKRDINFADNLQQQTTPEFDTTLGRWAYGGASNISSTTPAILTALLNPYAGASAFFGQAETQAYGKYRVRGAEPALAAVGGATEGVIEGAAQFLPFSFLADKMGKLGLGEFFVRLLGIDMASEQVSTVLQKVVDTSIANPDKTWRQAAAELPDEMGQTAVSVAMFAGMMAPVNTLARHAAREEVEIEKAHNITQTLNTVGEIATASELRKRDPGAFADFVADMTENAPIADVYVDAAKFGESLAQSGVSEAELARALPDVAVRFNEAQATQGDVRISLADYAARIAGGPLDNVLLQHVKATPEGLTYTEAQAALETQTERLKGEAERIAAERDNKDAWRESSASVEKELLAQLATANRFSSDVNATYAKFSAAMIDIAAARGGRSPEEQYVKYPLDIVAMISRPTNGVTVMEQGERRTAEAAGFDTSQVWLHGTTRDFAAFKVHDGGVKELGRGIYFTKDSIYANAWARGEGGRVLQTVVKKGDLFDLGEFRRKKDLPDGDRFYADLAKRIRQHPENLPSLVKGWLKEPLADFAQHIKETTRQGDLNTWLARAGYVGAFDKSSQVPDQIVVFRPEDIRSVNARFASAKAGSANLLAQSARSTSRVMFEVAPDPNNAALSARWNALPDHVKQQISAGVVGDIIPAVLEAVGVEGDIKPQIGGYLDDTNPSFALVLPEGADTAKVVEATKMAGFVLSQDSMMTVGEHPFDGGEKTGTIKIELPPDSDIAFVREVYDKLREIEVNGEKPISGHTTVEGRMAILNYSAVPRDELAGLVDKALNGEYTVVADELYAWFPSKKEYEYGRDTSSSGDATGRRPSVQGDAHRLRDEASRAIAAAIDSYEQTGSVENGAADTGGSPRSTLGQTLRGQIGFGDDITKTPSTIALLQNADLSTFLHELGHFNLQVMAHMASEVDAAPEIRQDMDHLLKWFGVPDLATWNGMTLDQQRTYHEQFARGFEAYLFEGKSPSLEMQGIFSRVRAWMIHVYKTLTSLDVQLTPEVRGVMDRLIASAEQIKEAQQARGMVPLFTEPQPGMTDTAWSEYQRDDKNATETALSIQQTRALRDMKWLSNAKSKITRDLQRQASAQRKTLAVEADKTIGAEPVYRAEEWLTKGTMTDAEGNTLELTPEARQGAKISRAALDEMFPPGDLARPDLTRLKGLVAEGGLSPDVVAEMFGYDSGRALVDALLARTPRKEAVRGLTDTLMLERHGEMFGADAIERAAEAAVHNELRARVIANEWRTLARIQGPVSMLAKAAKEAAETTISQRRIKDVRPKEFEAAEARASRAADAAMKKSDLTAAAEAKRAQLVNNRLARAATDALAEVDTAIARFKRLDKNAAQANMRGEYLDQLNTLLGRFDLRASVKPDASRVPLREWIANEADRLSAVMPDVPEWVLNDQYRTHYKNLTVEEMRGLADTVKQLELMARREQKQYMAIRAMEFAAERGAVLDEIRRNWPDAFGAEGEPKGTEPDFVPSIKKATALLGDKFAGEFLSPETIYSILGGGKYSIINESLFGRLSGQSDWKAHRLEKLYDDLKPLFDAYTLKEKRDFARTDIGTGTPANLAITRENALVVALLHGNAEGRERLSNYGWSETRQQQIIALLDARDMTLADGIWRMFDENLWPELKALNDRTRGKAPPKVEAMPYDTQHGKARGGYFRLKYDTDLDERAHRLDEGQAVRELLGGGMGMSAKTNQGTSTERKSNVTMRPRLDLGVFSEAVNETVHDLAYRESVADTIRMLNDTGIMQAIKQVVGTPGYRALVNRVREVAAPPRNPSGFIEKTISIARRNTIITLMSGVKTALQNFTGIAPAFAELNAGTLTREIAQFYSPKMLERYEFAMSQSDYMTRRFTSYDRDLQNAAGRLTINGRWLPETSTFLALMGLVDKGVAVPVWNAAFKQGMERFGNDTTKAVDYADHTVRQTQGSGREVDLPSIMAGHGGWGQLKRAFTMFYSYFNGQLNLLVKHGVISKIEARDNPQQAVANFSAKFVAIIVVPMVLTEMLMNGVVKDGEDPEEWLKRMAGAFVRYGAGFFPFVRDTVPAVWTQLTGEGHYFGVKVSPLDSAAEGFVEGVKSLKDVVKGEADKRDAKNLIMATGFIFGLPGKLVSDTVGGTRAWMDGDAGPEAVILGPPRKNN